MSLADEKESGKGSAEQPPDLPPPGNSPTATGWDGRSEVTGWQKASHDARSSRGEKK
nr:MAG TPA: hypothetical protein [Caudoviricetes sp.]